MSNESEARPLSTSELRGPEQHFNAYCEAERERRLNSDEPFDEAAFEQAAALVQRKLQLRKERVFE